MIALGLLVLVIVDTAVSGYMVARIRHLQDTIATQGKVIRDLSDCVADLDEVGDDAE